ncbi:MAG: MBL fold metallo-hydrolase [Gemmobacter sp.]
MSEAVAPGVTRIVAPNPSPFTFRGTNTYLVGRRDLAVIDPGPDDPTHLAAILAAVPPGGRIAHVVVTHAHRDHTALASRLSGATGAPVLAFGDAAAGIDPTMASLGDIGGGEGVDTAFRPDALLADGDALAGADWQLRVLHTPGHMGNHICLAMDGLLFSGDHAMGWATSIVSPPDGDMGAYMASLDRLIAEGPARLLPGHGDPVEDAPARLAALRDHRRGREAAIRAVLAERPATAEDLVRRLYLDVPPALHPAAVRNVLAHLLDLVRRELVEPVGPLGPAATFRRTMQR